jgi:uncharacterized protein YoxC
MSTRKILLTILLSSVLLIGCDSITPQQVQELAGSVQQLSNTVDEYQKVTDSTLASLKDQKLISAEAADKVAKVQTEIDKVQQQTKDVAAAVSAVKPVGDKVQDTISLARAANAATAPFNPYSPIIESILGVFSLVAGIFWKRASSNAALSAAKYAAHKAGVEAAKLALTADPQISGASAAELIYNKIGEKRSDMGVS